jgi:hypothetical protein
LPLKTAGDPADEPKIRALVRDATALQARAIEFIARFHSRGLRAHPSRFNKVLNRLAFFSTRRDALHKKRARNSAHRALSRMPAMPENQGPLRFLANKPF